VAPWQKAETTFPVAKPHFKVFERRATTENHEGEIDRRHGHEEINRV
jgi:hypothetical protein